MVDFIQYQIDFMAMHATANVTGSPKCVQCMHYAYTFQMASFFFFRHCSPPSLSVRYYWQDIADIAPFTFQFSLFASKKGKKEKKACTDILYWKWTEMQKEIVPWAVLFINKIRQAEAKKKRKRNRVAKILHVVICRRNDGVSSTCLWSNNP